MKLKLIVGLGNPGPEYSTTRHNAGFWFVDALAEEYTSRFSAESRFYSEIARIKSSGIDCRLIKPQTFMNESGRAVHAVMDYFDIPSENLLVVHDEIDLDAGVIRLKNGGGHGGHNGLRDIINHTGTPDFMRLRIGVSHPGDKQGVTPHVLGKPAKEDQLLIEDTIKKAVAVMPLVFEGKLEKAMTELHTD